MDFPFLKKETFGLRTQETFIGNKCEIYLSSNFLDKSNPPQSIAKELGDKIETMGLFWFNVDGQWYELQLPIKFQFQFSEFRKEKRRLKPGMPEGEYLVYTLHKGDAFVYDILHKKDLDDIKTDFLAKMIENAKIPNTVAYKDTFPIFIRAMTATETSNLGVSSVNLEVMMSELYRNKKNMREPYRKVYNGSNEYDYRMVSIKKLPELNSSFTALIGEDIQNQLSAAILRTREGAEDNISPVEKIIKY